MSSRARSFIRFNWLTFCFLSSWQVELMCNEAKFNIICQVANNLDFVFPDEA